MAVPVSTYNVEGSIRAASSLALSGTASYNLDYSAKIGGHIHVENTPGGSVSSTRGVQIDIYARYGTTPTNGSSPFMTYTLPSTTAATPESTDIWLGTGKYVVKITNLDATNAVTVQITDDTVDSIS